MFSPTNKYQHGSRLHRNVVNRLHHCLFSLFCSMYTHSRERLWKIKCVFRLNYHKIQQWRTFLQGCVEMWLFLSGLWNETNVGESEKKISFSFTSLLNHSCSFNLVEQRRGSQVLMLCLQTACRHLLHIMPLNSLFNKGSSNVIF